MAEDRMTSLFFEIFSGLPRQGPGDAASTRRALALIPGIGSRTRVLDLGCGTGLQARVLARSCAARIVGVDLHEPFVREFMREAWALGLADRMRALVGDIHRLPVHPGSVQVLWAEGSIFVIGFEEALREWRPLLAPGGHIALTEVCWTRPDPPAECVAFWEEEYPAIRSVADRLQAIDRCGYDTVAHFPLPRSAWWDDYYRPLQQNLVAFRERHAGDPDAERLAAGVQREIDMWHAYGEFYGYEFFVARARRREATTGLRAPD